ncbi:unnamed protein product [Musa hybrid cultivar]
MERQGCCWRSPYSPPGVVLGPRPSMAEKGGKGSRLSMNCEAAETLQEIQQHMTVLSMDPKIKLPRNYILSFSKALQYSKINGHCTNVQSVKPVLGYPLVINIYQLACVFCHLLYWTKLLVGP